MSNFGGVNQSQNLPPINGQNPNVSMSKVTVAPPIPSYYRTNINNFTSNLPNLSFQTPGSIAKTFSQKFQELKEIEEKLQSQKRNLLNNSYNNPNVNNNLPPIKEELKDKVNQKLTNPPDGDTLQKLNEIKTIKSSLETDFLKGKQIKKNKEEEYKRLYSKEGQKEFKISMIKALDQYSQSIRSQIANEQKVSQEYINAIKTTINEVKKDIYNQVENFENNSLKQINDIRRVMIKAPNSRMRQVVKSLFPKGKADEEEEEEQRQIKNQKNLRNSVKRMSVLVSKEADDAKSVYSRESAPKTKLQMIQESVKEFNQRERLNSDSSSTNDLNLDLWEKKRKEDNKLLNEVNGAILTYGQIPFEMRPINKFRSYVYGVIAARRILNVRYNTYKEFKVTSVRSFIENYEDMDRIIKKLVYNSVKDTVIDCISNDYLELNMITTNGVQHDVFLELQRVIEKMLTNLSENFFLGVSKNMLSYLALFLTNYSYIPRTFFTTFESVRFRVSGTGEFIEMETEQQKMILGFYIIIKILLKNIFLELMFNTKSIKRLKRIHKLNIKMLVSVLYRGLIDEYFKTVETRRNLEDLEEEEDRNNFMRIGEKKKEFTLETMLKRKKRYWLKPGEMTNRKRRKSEPTIDYGEGEYVNNVRLIKKKGEFLDDEQAEGKKRKKKKAKKKKNENNENEEESKSKSKKRSKSKSAKKKGKKIQSESPGSKKSAKKKKKSQSKTPNKNGGEEEEGPKKKKKTGKPKSRSKSNPNKKKEKGDEENKEDEINPKKTPKPKKKKAPRAPPQEEIEPPTRPNPKVENTKKKKAKGKTKSKSKSKSKDLGESPPKKSKSKSKGKKTKSKEPFDDAEQPPKKKKNIKRKKKANPKGNDLDGSLSPLSSRKKAISRSLSQNPRSKSISRSPSLEKKRIVHSKTMRNPKSPNKQTNSTKGSLNRTKRKSVSKRISRNGVARRSSLLTNKELASLIRSDPTLNAKDYTISEIKQMYFIVDNFQNFGDDSDANQFQLIDNVIYSDEALETYYLFAEEYGFDPITTINDFIEKLLEMIIDNFNK